MKTPLVRSRWPLLLAVSTLFLVAGCEDDPAAPGDENEQELITRVTITLTPVGGGATQSATINDPDGMGPLPPSAPSAVLQVAPGTTYNGTVRVFDASNPNDIEDLTPEVEEEAEEHRFFYTLSGVNGVTIPTSSLDTDANGAPLGLTFQVVASPGASGTGLLRVLLSHYDDSPKGDGSVPSNETDVDVSFQIRVQ